MKKILVGSILLISFILTVPEICFLQEPMPCSSWTLIGPPVVGTWVVDYLGLLDGKPNLSFQFSGCCADCFENCKNSCNVKMKWTDNTLGVMPEDIQLTHIQNYNLGNQAPKNCNPINPIVGGTELKDLVVDTILKFDNQTDIDGDEVKEMVAQVVMYYYVCNQ